MTVRDIPGMTLRMFNGLLDEIERVSKLEQGEQKEKAMTGKAAQNYFAKLSAKNRKANAKIR